jgi:hypothetical protein
VASAAAERAAFGQLVAQLRDGAAANARALHDHLGTPAGQVLDQQLEYTLDRLALLYGRGTYENLSTEEIFGTAMDDELHLAAAMDEPESAAALTRAQGLLDAARRGVRLHVRGPARPVRLLHGVYVEPLRPEFQRSLWSREAPYLRWRDGAVVIVDEEEVAALRAAGDEVNVLFLDPDELLDLDARDDRPALEAELERRLVAARAASDRVGDSRDRYVLRMLLRHSTVLRNLRDRLADGHPSAHEALLPILAEHRALLQGALAAAPATRAVRQDPLAATTDSERGVQALVSQWAAEPGDPAGLRGRFRAATEAGTSLADLERLTSGGNPDATPEA